MLLLNAQELCLGYEGKRVASSITFCVRPGDYLFIVGENGSGKSTLMKTVLGLLSPIEGEITLGDGLKHNEIGYLPQQTVVQRDFPASVREVVLSGCLKRSGPCLFYTREDKECAATNMEKLGISALSKHCYRELSGGQQQRVLLARALCAARKILLLDEPVAGLDPKAAMDMYQIIKELNEKHGLTIVMISHDVSAAIKYASHILHIKENSSFFGNKQDYLETDMGKNFSNIGER
ncbi:MAG: ABC transporter ATP-binding protein [Eubacteriales bacterium]|nr:ABC transporter ATP-binding protein [Eubacteriales bacterium]MDD4389400.1 ABC transporter ATP-binding protein [Eubacteriales bacterium]